MFTMYIFFFFIFSLSPFLCLSASPAAAFGRNHKSRAVAEGKGGQEGRRRGGLVEGRQGRL